jgi:prepilin-type N-terminal cleavage/methylation domain-containing protein
MKFNSIRGFTLLEIIITLTTLAVLATMIYTYFGKAFLESVTPITRLKNTAALQRVMENIKADCNVYPRWRSETAYTQDISVVTPTAFNGFYYKCTTAGSGVSGTTEPVWKEKINDITDPESTGMKWTMAGKLRDKLSLETLKGNIGEETFPQDNNYGKYYVVKNDYIQFDNANQEIADNTYKKILKVTIKNGNGETLTALFFSD